MIAKHVPMRSIKKSDFAELVKYITDEQGKTERLSDAHRAGCPRRWAGGRLWPCKRARNAVEAVCETPRPPALWIPRGKLGPH